MKETEKKKMTEKEKKEKIQIQRNKGRLTAKQIKGKRREKVE